MLSLNGDKSSRLIALINPDTDKFEKQKYKEIYLTEGESMPIETTDENKRKIFSKFLDLNKKLRLSEIENLMKAYDGKESVDGKLERVLVDGKNFVNESLKKYIDYGSEVNLFPVIKDPSYRLFVSGLSGSGKSTMIASFIKHNPPRKGAGVFLFSPVTDDPSLKPIKNLIQINIDAFEEEIEREIEIEDFPEGSICIFDDIETFKKGERNKYLELRDTIAERGRHQNLNLITVTHNATAGEITKVSIRESQYWLTFPQYNKRDASTLFKNYGGFSKSQIDQILSQKSRWCLLRKAIPQYAVFQHSVISF